MRWQGRERSSNIEDRRGQSGGGGGGGGMGIVGLIVVLVGAYYGVDLSGLVGGTPQLGTSSARQTTLSSKEEARLEELSAVVLADTEKTWQE